jgi:hypothetical protein
MFPELTAEEVDYVIAKVTEWDRQTAGKAATPKQTAAVA